MWGGRKIEGPQPADQAAPQQLPSPKSSLASPHVEVRFEKSPLSEVAIGPVSILPSIDQFLTDLAAAPQEISDCKKITQELIVAATDKFTVLNDGRYWDREIPDETKQYIANHYPDVESFLSHQKHLAFPKQIQKNGEPLSSADSAPLHPFSLAVLRHIASPAVYAIDLTPEVGAKIESGSDGIYSVISFGARLGILPNLGRFLFPNAHHFTLMHEGAHHLLCSVAAGKDGGPSWLKHSLVEPPRRMWGLGEILRSNHATLYGEVLANYVAYGGDVEAAVRETRRSYPSQWKIQFLSRFPCAKRLSAEKIIAGLQQLTERYPAATWLDLQNIDNQDGEISKLLS